jgi:hypothetical protein
MKTTIILVIVAALLFAGVAAGKTKHHQHHPRPPALKAYAQKAAAIYGWTGTQWDAIDDIVTHESGWNPCAYNPSHSDCGYTGSASCGLPQAQPCPYKWRGRMWETRYLQVWWMLHYIHDRYGTPLNALAFRGANNWY